AQGDEDDDWFCTYYQPYRYMVNRVPVYPCIGNHDAGETEDRDDREQLLDNLFLRERIARDAASGRASVDPGLFYRAPSVPPVRREGRRAHHHRALTAKGCALAVRECLPRVRAPRGSVIAGTVLVRTPGMADVRRQRRAHSTRRHADPTEIRHRAV